jgi:hypothetical protein
MIPGVVADFVDTQTRPLLRLNLVRIGALQGTGSGYRGDVAQMGERCVRNAEVGSSILPISTT